MKYYSEEQIRDQFDPFECEAFFKRQNSGSINVRRCRDCPLFELNYFQPVESLVQYGWCRRMSYYETLDDEDPYYIYVNSNDFCNEDDIREEDE